MRKLKIGDRVVLRSDLEFYKDYGKGGHQCRWHDHMKESGVVTIVKVEDKGQDQRFWVDGHYGYCTAMIDYIIREKEMTKDDLNNGDIVKLRNGDELVMCGGELHVIRNGSYFEDLDMFKNNLEHKTHKGSDIVAVAPYQEPNWTWQRTEEKEVTMAEVNAKFGYPVKIVEKR